ncbi:MAG: DUF3791 domain-containing protein [Clostridia bacterium]|nr:DUF3791 domain-containing protein [Clostridia bacterium]
MLDEVLFMETRLLRQFGKRFHIDSIGTNSLFNKYGIWDYLERCYDYFHTCGDEYILDDITEVLRAKGVAI